MTTVSETVLELSALGFSTHLLGPVQITADMTLGVMKCVFEQSYPYQVSGTGVTNPRPGGLNFTFHEFRSGS